MENKSYACMMAVGILLTGCATGKSRIVLDPVGPPPAQAQTVQPDKGTLTVFSAFEVNADFNSRDPYRSEYSDYRIYSNDGKLLRFVKNDDGSNFGSPGEVSLAPGGYRVVARANGYGTVTVPVEVDANRVTTIHLEGGYTWPNNPGFDKAKAVCLPGGEMVGWKNPLKM
jgi:hypothetical protein